jgi:hypothetical protein
MPIEVGRSLDGSMKYAQGDENAHVLAHEHQSKHIIARPVANAPAKTERGQEDSNSQPSDLESDAQPLRHDPS